MARGAAGQSGDPWPWPVFEHAILFSISLDVRYWPPVSAEFSKAVRPYMGRLCSLFYSNASAPSGALIK